MLFVITALVLTLQEYYGGRDFYDDHIKPSLRELEKARRRPVGGSAVVNLKKYDELYGYGWWAFTRIFGYVAVPLLVWKIIFRKDSLLDMGLRTRGFLEHAWIYVLCLAVVLPAMLIVSRAPDFGTTTRSTSSARAPGSTSSMLGGDVLRAVLRARDLLPRLLARALRTTLGSGAIFAMGVPYCMIHYGKPYLEAAGAIVAGIALGSLSMRTKSIYSGFLVHVTVALLMDLLALSHRNALPTSFWGL